MRILAVDDDPLILDLLRESLTVNGYCDLTCTASAEEAHTAMEQATEPFDCFLLDIVLPETDGIALCADIRAMDAYKMTPIIMITASRQPDMMERAFAAGATDFVTKPLDGLELGTRVNIASMLNDSMMRERESRHTLAELTRLTRISFEERFAMADVPELSDYLMLENHLLRFSSGCYAMTLFAVEVEGAKAIFRTASAPTFRARMEAAARAVAGQLDPGATRIAYAGRGVFVGVAHGRGRMDLQKLQDDAQASLDQGWDSRSLGSDAAPDLTVRAISTQRVWAAASACDALQSFLARMDLNTTADPQDEEALFAALERKLARRA